MCSPALLLHVSLNPPFSWKTQASGVSTVAANMPTTAMCHIISISVVPTNITKEVCPNSH